MKYKKRIILIVSILLVSVILDQATKWMAIAWLKDGPPIIYLNNMFRLQYAENTGAFLGLFGTLSETVRSFLLVGFNSVILIIVSAYLLLSRDLSRIVVIALALILSGGIGNLYDRVVYGGYVVDFMNLGLPWVSIRGWEPRTGIFNIADMAIMAGLGLMIVAEFVRPREVPDTASDTSAAEDEAAQS